MLVATSTASEIAQPRLPVVPGCSSRIRRPTAVFVDGDGVTSAPTTVSQLTLRGTNVIQVVSTDDQPAPRGVVFQANDSITVEEGAAFVLEGARNATRVVVDAAAKTVSLETSLGTTIIFR